MNATNAKQRKRQGKHKLKCETVMARICSANEWNWWLHRLILSHSLTHFTLSRPRELCLQFNQIVTHQPWWHRIKTYFVNRIFVNCIRKRFNENLCVCKHWHYTFGCVSRDRVYFFFLFHSPFSSSSSLFSKHHSVFACKVRRSNVRMCV